MVGRWRNKGWGSTIWMKMRTSCYLMSKVHDVEFQFVQGMRKKMVVLLTQEMSEFRKRKHRSRSGS